MVHNEHFRRADELYEIWHDNNGQAIHMLIKDGEAIIFKDLHDFVLYNYLGTDVDRVYISEDALNDIPDECRYNYYKLRDYVSRSVLEDTFVTALEGGSNYWAYIEQNTLAKVRKENVPISVAILHAVLDGVDIDVYDVEHDHELVGTISLKTMPDRLALLMTDESYNYALVNVMKGEYDANDADIVFQYIVMGEVTYA
jgi:hypothetical protein